MSIRTWLQSLVASSGRRMTRPGPRRHRPGARLPLWAEALEGRDLPSFTGPFNFPVGEQPLAIAVGDFNLDEAPDLAVGHGRPGTSVILGNGDGTFRPPENHGSLSNFKAVGDLNADGFPDLVGLWGVLLGNGDGTFQPVLGLPWFEGYGAISSVVIGDFNGDGAQDLVGAGNTCTEGGGLDGTWLMLGNGDGTFQPGQRIFASCAETVLRGDFNADGAQDLVVGSRIECQLDCSYNEVHVVLGNGDGTFQPGRLFLWGRNFPVPSVEADFNNDGAQDLTVSSTEWTDALLANGDGDFRFAYTLGVGTVPMAAGDFNGDGNPDLVLTVRGSNSVRVHLGNGDGRFQQAQTFTVGSQPFSAAVGDFNQDAYPDIAVTNRGSGDVSILLNDGEWPGSVAHFYVYPDTATVSAGAPIDLAVFALNAAFGLVPNYAGEILFLTTDEQATTPGQYRFRPQDGGIALFAGGVTFRTPGVQALLVIDAATYSVFGFAVFDVVAPYGGGPAPGSALDLFISEVLGSGPRPARR